MSLVLYDAEQRRNERLQQVVRLNRVRFRLRGNDIKQERSTFSTCSMRRSSCSTRKAIWAQHGERGDESHHVMQGTRRRLGVDVCAAGCRAAPACMPMLSFQQSTRSSAQLRH